MERNDERMQSELTDYLAAFVSERRRGRMEEYIERSTAMLQTVEAKAIISNNRVKRVLGKLAHKLKPQFGYW